MMTSSISGTRCAAPAPAGDVRSVTRHPGAPARTALMAGVVIRTSPIESSLTHKMLRAFPHRARASAGKLRRLSRGADTLDDAGRRSVLHERQDLNGSTVRFDNRHLGKHLDRVVTALCEDVWLDQLDQLLRRVLLESDHVVDAAQGGEDLDPIVERVDGARRALESR